MLNNGMPVLWITINLSDLQSPLVLILVSMPYKFNSANIITETFARMTATINSIAVARFFESTCHDIFEQLLATGFKDEGFFGPISIYFGIVEINSRGMLHLHCLV